MSIKTPLRLKAKGSMRVGRMAHAIPLDTGVAVLDARKAMIAWVPCTGEEDQAEVVQCLRQAINESKRAKQFAALLEWVRTARPVNIIVNFLRTIAMALKTIILPHNAGTVAISQIARVTAHDEGVGVYNAYNKSIGWIYCSSPENKGKIVEIFDEIINNPGRAQKPDWTFLYEAEAVAEVEQE